MIAPRPTSSSTRRRYQLTPAVTFLIRAFAPGCPTLLRQQSATRLRGPADRVAIVYDLPDARARSRAAELASSAASLQMVAVGRQIIRDVDVSVSDVLTVSVLLVRR